MTSSQTPPPSATDRTRGVSAHTQILLGMATGGVAGLLARKLLPATPDGTANTTLEFIARNIAEPLGQIFLRLIFMVVVPLVFAALALGVAQIGDLRRLGRLGLRTLGFTVLLSSLSVVIGLGLVNSLRPGMRLTTQKREDLKRRYATGDIKAVSQAKQAKTAKDTLLDIIPRNPLQEMVGAIDGSSPGGGMLAVMFFALAVGVAITTRPDETRALVATLDGVYHVAMAVIGFAMRLAPIGIAGLMFSVTALLGVEILSTLAYYMGTVILGLCLHMFGVYSACIAVFARMSPRTFFAGIWEAILTAFSTSSSSASLPTALRVAEKGLGIRRDIASFVLTVGSTANQNGTALYEGITVLFLAQVFGVELTIAQQLQVVLMSILAGIGTAGVPGGSLPLVVIVMQSVGVPGEGIGIILGVDRLLDMCRTTVNVAGDITIAACVDRAEKNA